jgi:hypothetical protein
MADATAQFTDGWTGSYPGRSGEMWLKWGKWCFTLEAQDVAVSGALAVNEVNMFSNSRPVRRRLPA